MATVTLHDGRQVDSASEDWRHETEARSILSLRNVTERRDWLDAIEKRRGKASADRLRETVQALWKARR